MAAFLMGFEVEHSMSAHLAGLPLSHEQIHKMMLSAIREHHNWLPDARNSAGIYLENGSRYYLDTGAHNELSSPELDSPQQVAVYDRAAERILVAARDRLMAKNGRLNICITKANINLGLPDDQAWGQHESYTCRRPMDETAAALIPHLVTRLAYASAGFLSADRRGCGFELSQRAKHLTRVTGSHTTRDRAIFCTRGFSSSTVARQGWTRLHLICKDSQRCSFGMYLTYGATALLLCAMNDGHSVGNGLQLKHPVNALRTISLDPRLTTRIPMADGRSMTAVDIQRCYVDQVAAYANRAEAPAWAGELLNHWSSTLDQLARDPLLLCRRLDPYLKLAMFDHEIRRANSNWQTLHRALQVIDRVRQSNSPAIMRAVLDDSDQDLNREQATLFAQLSRHRRRRRVTVDQVRLAVRLQAMELKYHELGGLFDQLDSRCLVDPVVVRDGDIRDAIQTPPPGGRAAARSDCIRRHSGDRKWVCYWHAVISTDDGSWYDLRNPFQAPAKLAARGANESDLNPIHLPSHNIPF